MSFFHEPVMLKKCLEALQLKSGGVYVDATLGGGGHSQAMLTQNPEIELYAFDQDCQALEYAAQVLEPWQDRINLVHSNFARIRTHLALSKICQIDGILFDLGVSSRQIDDKDRGFSFEGDAPLDMRMDQNAELTALQIVNEYSRQELKHIFKDFGEELHADRIAKAIEQERLKAPLLSTAQLASIVTKSVSGSPQEVIKSKARIFQSLRIAVNRELEILPQSIVDAINILKPGGRIVVLSYHSLEDRIVKNVFRTASLTCTCPPQSIICTCKSNPKIRVLSRKPIQATKEETAANPRSRSAKLRFAERI
ncbi:MAG: 16S rRNA (cytosine(1402)-N(4))-methyltransferase RsmH [Candidatus Cloacimonetes bacterium]|nr:16S rRNA (cytosine(1402)-N(4))-methyltransferase RsmH [Candidatus Cloacimonadota bacterium]